MRRAPLLGTLLLLVAPLPSFGAGCEAFVGEWHWFTNHRVTIKGRSLPSLRRTAVGQVGV